MQEQLQGHPEVFYDNFGMHKHVFQCPLKALGEKAGLTDSKHVSAIEQLGIFWHRSHNPGASTIWGIKNK